MKVAGIQFDIAWEDVETNVARAGEIVQRAADGGAELLVLPEMYATGFTMNAEFAASAHDRSVEAVQDLARKHGVWMAAGVVESGADRARNCCILVDPDGTERLRYRKIHPFSLAREHEFYDGGTTLETLEIGGLRVTPLVCYDLRFPEPFRIAADGTDLFLVVANWPRVRTHAWSTLLVSRAIENLCYVVGVNRVGESDGIVYTGASAVIDPIGETLSDLHEESGVVVADVTAEEVARVRKRFGFLADRRPDLYDRLANERRPKI